MDNNEASWVLNSLWCWDRCNKREQEALMMGAKALKHTRNGKWQHAINKKVGAWKCSECHVLSDYKTKYCAGCGAEMEE